MDCRVRRWVRWVLVLAATWVAVAAQPPQLADFESNVAIDNVNWRSTTTASVTEGHFREALARATGIISRYCTVNVARVMSRVAPIRFERLDAGVLMQSRATFVLQHGVWVPMSLAIERETDAWDLDKLLRSSQYDIQITVNTGVDLIIGGPRCTWAGEDVNDAFYSATTLLLHELLHGLGFYSLVSSHQGGGYQGSVSLYDSLLRYTHNGSYVFGDPLRVQDVYGTRLSKYAVSIGPHAVYNPANFVQGKSLSHLLQQPSIMNAAMQPASCMFELDNQTIDVMNLMGWRCNESDTPHVVPPGHQLRCDNTTECVCVLNELCLPCADANSLDQLVTILLTLAISLCVVMIATVGYCTNFETCNEVDNKFEQTTRFVPIINNF